MTIFEFKDYKVYVQHRLEKKNLRGELTAEQVCDLVLHIDFFEVASS